jgi:hypothetical protein
MPAVDLIWPGTWIALVNTLECKELQGGILCSCTGLGLCLSPRLSPSPTLFNKCSQMPFTFPDRTLTVSALWVPPSFYKISLVCKMPIEILGHAVGNIGYGLLGKYDSHASDPLADFSSRADMAAHAPV